jgi:hypothetical protein
MQRPGTFEPGHQKFGGRKKGTPNSISAEEKKAIVEAMYRIGSDLNGKDGVLGYFMWLATQRRTDFVSLLIHLILMEGRGGPLFAEMDFSAEEHSESLKEFIAFSDDRPRQNTASANYDADPFSWTGQKPPVSTLMDRAVRKPDEFCQLVASAFFASKSERRQRRAAERREWMRKRAQQSAESGA